jgi:hypothetical protein
LITTFITVPPDRRRAHGQGRRHRDRFRKYLESTGNDLHSSFSDPHFVDPASNDFHLGSGSPAITAGTDAGLPVGELDLDGSLRVTSGKIDIGCYQRK